MIFKSQDKDYLLNIAPVCNLRKKVKKNQWRSKNFCPKFFFGQTLEESSRIYFDYFHYSYFSLSSVVSSKWVNLIHTTARGIHKYLHIYCSSYFYLHRKFNNNVLEFFLVREVSNVSSWIRASVIKKEFHVVDLIFRKMYQFWISLPKRISKSNNGNFFPL